MEGRREVTLGLSWDRRRDRRGGRRRAATDPPGRQRPSAPVGRFRAGKGGPQDPRLGTGRNAPYRAGAEESSGGRRSRTSPLKGREVRRRYGSGFCAVRRAVLLISTANVVK